MSRRCRLALVAAGAALAAAPAQAAAPRVAVSVADRAGALTGAWTVRAAATRVRVGRRSCTVGRATPLAALAAARRAGGPRFRVRDYGACSRSARDAGGLFVFQVGDDRNRRRNGWVYKVGRRLGTAGAADPTGPFGSGRLRSGQSVLWFWCRMSRAGSCQRTLEARPAARRVAAGAPLRVTVRGYDDAGRGRPIGGAAVRLGHAEAITDARGAAELTAPTTSGRYRLTAARRGLAPASPVRVEVE